MSLNRLLGSSHDRSPEQRASASVTIYEKTIREQAQRIAELETKLDVEEGRVLSLLKAVAELEKNAARYKLLRECDWFAAKLCVVYNPKKFLKLGADCLTRERLDEQLDMAINEQKK